MTTATHNLINADTSTRTARLFKNGRSQAVRLPAEFRIDAEEVQIQKISDSGILLLTPKRKIPNWQDFFKLTDNLLDATDKDFLLERDNSKTQERELF